MYSVFIYLLCLNFPFLFQLPRTPEEWVNIASDFGHLHQFWNTLGAIDGKHIAIKNPQNQVPYTTITKGFSALCY